MTFDLEATSASDSASPDGDDLSKVQLVIVDLGNKDGRHGLIERGAVHVDRGPDRQHEADDAPVDVVVLQEALEGDRQCGRTAEGNSHILHTFPIWQHSKCVEISLTQNIQADLSCSGT